MRRERARCHAGPNVDQSKRPRAGFAENPQQTSHRRVPVAPVEATLTGPPGAELELVAVSKTFGPVVAVDGVSLAVASGEFVTLLGPSGSGKTTTLMMIAGFESATSGEILLGGRRLTHVPPYRRNLGMVFQHYALFPHMTVHDNVAFPLRTRGVTRGETDRRGGAAPPRARRPPSGARFPAPPRAGPPQRA